MADIDKQPKRYTWSLDNTGNRDVLAIVIGWLAWPAAARVNLWVFLLAAVVSYLVITALIKRRNRDYDGTDRHR